LTLHARLVAQLRIFPGGWWQQLAVRALSAANDMFVLRPRLNRCCRLTKHLLPDCHCGTSVTSRLSGGKTHILSLASATPRWRRLNNVARVEFINSAPV
jgi:hypothetical protein